jgi:endonuclease III
LKNQFPRWGDILNAKRRVVVEALRPGGLARQKAERIVDILRWLRKREGKVSLTFLKRMGRKRSKMNSKDGLKTVHCSSFLVWEEAFPVTLIF